LKFGIDVMRKAGSDGDGRGFIHIGRATRLRDSRAGPVTIP
jgi:hypothetical protein